MAYSIVCRLHQNTSHVQSEDAGSVKMAVFLAFFRIDAGTRRLFEMEG